MRNSILLHKLNDLARKIREKDKIEVDIPRRNANFLVVISEDTKSEPGCSAAKMVEKTNAKILPPL